MELFSKDKILFHSGTKNDLFDGRKRYPVDGGKKESLFDGGKAEDLSDGWKYKDLVYHVWRAHMDYIKTVDPNVLLKARDKDGNTPLLIAASMCYANVYKVILKKCPQLLYQENNYNITVLHQAKSFSSIDFFVSTGLNEAVTSNKYMKFMRWMTMQDSKGDTALVHAVPHHNLQAVKRFVEVDRQYNLGLPKVVGFDGKTALIWAMEIQDLEIVKILLGRRDPHSDILQYSIAVDLFLSLKSGDLDYIKTVEVNLLLNSRGEDGMSLLCIATNWDQLDCCEEILKRCPSLLYHHDNKKWSVLHHAAHSKIYRLIDFFVSAGLKAAKSEGGTENMILFQKWINLQNMDGDTALIQQ